MHSHLHTPMSQEAELQPGTLADESIHCYIHTQGLWINNEINSALAVIWSKELRWTNNMNFFFFSSLKSFHLQSQFPEIAWPSTFKYQARQSGLSSHQWLKYTAQIKSNVAQMSFYICWAEEKNALLPGCRHQNQTADIKTHIANPLLLQSYTIKTQREWTLHAATRIWPTTTRKYTNR